MWKKKELLNTAVGKINKYMLNQNQNEGSAKNKNGTTMWPNNTAPGYTPEGHNNML